MATLRGSVRRITFRNEENHFTVAKISPDDHATPVDSDEVTVVGLFASISVGEWLEAEGDWHIHGEFGRQFKVDSYRQAPPATARGIERYLASGAVEGIGPKLAERLVAKFGERTLEVIEKEPHRLLEVEGIGTRKKKAIGKAVKSEQDVRDTLIFLQGFGVTSKTAAKIYRQYGDETVAKVRENPYRLADEVFGIGFLTADRMAMEMGIAPESPTRAGAALIHILNQGSAEGHVFLPEDELLRRAGEMEIPEEAAREGLDRLAAAGDIKREPGRPDDVAVYPSFLYRAEVGVAERLLALCRGVKQEADPTSFGQRTFSEATPAGSSCADLSFPDSSFTDSASPDPSSSLTPEQRRAVALASAPGGGVLVLTGVPGTGKTTTLRAIVEALSDSGRTYRLGAPTGRAAKRLQEASGEEAVTLHRLLEFSGNGEGRARFQRNERTPLDADVVVVDEASMVDLPLMYHLLRALPDGAKLILVGDADQLPSVGPGNVLRDILAAPQIPSVKLTQVFRQAESSRIVVNAHRIQRGDHPLSGGEESDFFFLPERDSEAAVHLVLDLVGRRLPAYLGCRPNEGVQVLSTVRRGRLGVENLNQALQERLNPKRDGEAQVQVGGQTFRVNDRVMQVRNNYDKMVFNGDIGRVSAVDPKERTLEVRFPDRDEPAPVVYQSDDLNQLTLAYCTSVHKSQGSEYPAVVMPVTWVMPALMTRNLIYTAVTRARRLVVLVGREDALRAYVRNDRADRRFTRLAERLGAPSRDV